MTPATCPSCKAPVGAGTRFCAGCGSPLSAEATKQDLGGLTVALPVGRSALSIAAGYLGLFSILVLPAPFAVIVGIVALIDLKRRPHLLGRGRAVFGIVAGAVICLLVGLAWIFG